MVCEIKGIAHLRTLKCLDEKLFEVLIQCKSMTAEIGSILTTGA